MPIDFKEIQDYGEYVTGIAPYSDPDGQGNFNLRVSCSRDALESFAKTATIVRLKIEPLTEASLEWLHQTELRAAGERRKYLLEYPEEAWQAQREQARQDREHRRVDFSQDRFVEIQTADKMDKDQIYFVSYYLDPETVAQGRRDVWAVPGNMIPRGGFPSHSYLLEGSFWRGIVTSFLGVAVYDYFGAYLIRNEETIVWGW